MNWKSFFQCENVENKIANVELIQEKSEEWSDGSKLGPVSGLFRVNCPNVHLCNGPSLLKTQSFVSQSIEFNFTLCCLYGEEIFTNLLKSFLKTII